jgi:hypothetical protein
MAKNNTLLKEVDAKIFAAEDEVVKLVDVALKAPPLELSQLTHLFQAAAPTSAPMSAQGSAHGSNIYENGASGSLDPTLDPSNLPRRQHFHQFRNVMQSQLQALDEKNHVLNTAADALDKQLRKVEDVWPYVENEFSEEARLGSSEHWAYAENHTQKTGPGGSSRKEHLAVNNLSAAAQLVQEESAARSETRRQAMNARKANRQHIESDFDDAHDSGRKEKKIHGNSKVRKTADAPAGIGLGITNGVPTNGVATKRRRTDNAPKGGVGMERAMSGVFGSNGIATKKSANEKEHSPSADAPKKRQRVANATNGAAGTTRKRSEPNPCNPDFLLSYSAKPR